MDKQTKVGTGAAAAIALLALLEPHLIHDHPILGGLIYLLLAGVVLWGFAPVAQSAVQRMRGTMLGTWGPWLLILGGPAVGLIWLYMSHVALPLRHDSTRAANKSELDGTIKLECISEPFRLPADGKLVELIVHTAEGTPASFQNRWLSEYAYRERPDIIPTRYGRIDKCRVTNFGTAPVFNVKISLTIQFSEHIKKNAIWTEQRTIGSQPFEILLPQIDPGQSGASEFLAWNTSKYHASVIFDGEVELQRLGSADREMAKLIPAFNMLSLWPPEPDANAVPKPTAADVTGPASSPGLFIECSRVMLPFKVQPGQRIFAVNLWPSTAGGGGFGEYSMVEGVEFNLPGHSMGIQRCAVTNYEPKPLTHVKIDFEVAFREAIKEGIGLRGGDITMSGKWPIHIGKIDMGTAASFVFYMFNVSEDFATVGFPATATATPIGEAAEKTVPLATSAIYPIGFPPQMGTQPPAESTVKKLDVAPPSSDLEKR
jgi:hypothetical protein